MEGVKKAVEYYHLRADGLQFQQVVQYFLKNCLLGHHRAMSTEFTM